MAHSTGDATRMANVIAVLEDEPFGAEVDAERATLRVAADAPGDSASPQPLKYAGFLAELARSRTAACFPPG